MASFLYYCVEVNWMKWLKKYWWYIVISFSSSFVGGIICITITNKNIGSLADWVSGIGSLLAIAFAYWQIHIQTKEYEEDKKEKISREILANRPFFSLVRSLYLKKGRDHLWLTNDDSNLEKLEAFFKNNTEYRKGVNEYAFKNDIYVYEFINISQAAATKLALKIEYQNETSDEILKTDYCCIKYCVIGNQRAIILPHSMMNESNAYALCPKSVYLYFSTIDDKVYCQRWIEKSNDLGYLDIEQVDIMEVSKEEMPKEGSYICINI